MYIYKKKYNSCHSITTYYIRNDSIKLKIKIHDKNLYHAYRLFEADSDFRVFYYDLHIIKKFERPYAILIRMKIKYNENPKLSWFL